MIIDLKIQNTDYWLGFQGLCILWFFFWLRISELFLIDWWNDFEKREDGIIILDLTKYKLKSNKIKVIRCCCLCNNDKYCSICPCVWKDRIVGYTDKKHKFTEQVKSHFNSTPQGFRIASTYHLFNVGADFTRVQVQNRWSNSDM